MQDKNIRHYFNSSNLKHMLIKYFGEYLWVVGLGLLVVVITKPAWHFMWLAVVCLTVGLMLKLLTEDPKGKKIKEVERTILIIIIVTLAVIVLFLFLEQIISKRLI